MDNQSMDNEKWARTINANAGTIAAGYTEALAIGLADPVIILADAREGAARKIAIENWTGTVEELDSFFAAASAELAKSENPQAPFFQFPMEREHLQAKLPRHWKLPNIDRSRHFVVVYTEANEVNHATMTRPSPEDN